MNKNPIYDEEPVAQIREETIDEMLARLCLPESEVNELLSQADHLFDKVA